jgi:hypothetical protein
LDSEIDSLRELIRAGPSRGLDFVKLEELNRRTGIEAKDVLPFALSELLCNALDKHDASEINIDVQTVGDFDVLTVSDNGKKKFERSDLELILDFENKASSKRGFLQVSRGILGNALKCIFGYTYALAESRRLVPQPITISSGVVTYPISIKPNKIGQVIESQIIEQPRIDDGFTSVQVCFPANRDRALSECVKELRSKIVGSAIVNPTRKISFNLFGEEATIGMAQEGNEIRQETSVLWYNAKQFIELFEDYLRTSPDSHLKNFIGMFRGFSRKAAIRDILHEVNGSNVDAEAQKMQFVPSLPLKDLSDQAVRRLFSVMKGKSKAISKRSIPDVLGCVGQENFEKLRQQHGWPRSRYVQLIGIKRLCPNPYHSSEPCENLDHVELPYLVELAIIDRNDHEGLQLYEAVNFMASSHHVFSSMFDIQYRLGRVGIAQSSHVTIIVHVVSPVLPWLNYGKTSLGDIDSRGLMEQAFDKLLPIPRTPREYHPPPPPRPFSWVPHGELHDPEYEQRLRPFAAEIKAIDAQSTYHVRPRMRGWGYRCEDRGLIHKGEFAALAKAINNCRKIKLLPMDIISPDPDESRHFKGIHRVANPKAILEELRNEIQERLGSLPLMITDVFKGEKYYVIMVVEKGEILNVFGSVCRDYFVPHVSSKGWSNLEIRANIAEQCLWAVANGLIPVLLLFYDLDLKGIEQAETFRKNLKDMERATGWNPDTMIIERFGLNKDQVEKFGLSWVDNLKTSSGKDPKPSKKLSAYIQSIGYHKCEMESLFKNDETLRAAEQICREAIEKYYGPDAKERFQKKELESKGKLKNVYESPVWNELDAELTRIEEGLADLEPKEEAVTPSPVQEKQTEVIVDNKYYGVCPKCRTQFNYDEEKDIGRAVRCRNCNTLMRLTKKTEVPIEIPDLKLFIPTEARRTIAHLFSQGTPIKQIAAEYKISEQHVADILTEIMQKKSDGKENPYEADEQENPDDEESL